MICFPCCCSNEFSRNAYLAPYEGGLFSGSSCGRSARRRTALLVESVTVLMMLKLIAAVHL